MTMPGITRENIIRFCDIVIEWAFYLTIPAVTFSTSLVEITVTTMIVVWIIKKFLDRDLSGMTGLPFKFLLIYVIWAILSCFNSAYAKESFRGVFKVLEYSLLFAAAAGIRFDTRKIRITLYVIGGTLIITAVNGFYQYFSGADLISHRTLIADDYLRRISSSFVHPNDLGAYLMVFLLVCISMLLIYSRSIRSALKAGIPALFSGIALIMTKSRGAWLSFTGGLFVLGSLISRKVFLALIGGLIAVFLLLPAGTRQRVFELADMKSGTTWERLKLWEGTINMIEEHPVLGFGVNTYSRNFPDHRPDDYPDVRYSHNCYLHMASEIGIPGALAYILFMVAVLWRGYSFSRGIEDDRKKAFLKGLVAGLAGFALNSAVDTHLYSVTLAVYFHILLGTVYALTLNERDA
jgi:putative inorganic carbon (HCO3(-)) transporter